ncbi:MAG: hypothetical protein EPO40_17505 [Myxococcaceae bacterium]|nr:MAG: hypothetical protein EPO40_17505 [Myxococcaceae bacterium]
MNSTNIPAPVTITERTVLRRLNRDLAKEGLAIRVCRYDSRWYSQTGRYYCTEGRMITHENVNLELWAREAGVLKPTECIKE